MGDEQAGSCAALTPRLAEFDSLIPHHESKRCSIKIDSKWFIKR